MSYASFQLRRATRLIGTIMRSLTVDTHKRRSALGTTLYEAHLIAHQQTHIKVDTRYFGDNLTTLFHKHRITYMKVEFLYYIGIVQRCPAHNRTREQHRIEIRDRSNHTCASYLIGNLIESRSSLLGLKLVCNGPTGRLGCVTKMLLLTQGVHLEHYTVCCKGQFLALYIHCIYKIENLVERVAFACSVRYFEAPLAGCSKILEMSVTGELLAQEIVEIGIETTLGHHRRIL